MKYYNALMLSLCMLLLAGCAVPHGYYGGRTGVKIVSAHENVRLFFVNPFDFYDNIVHHMDDDPDYIRTLLGPYPGFWADHPSAENKFIAEISPKKYVLVADCGNSFEYWERRISKAKVGKEPTIGVQCK